MEYITARESVESPLEAGICYDELVTSALTAKPVIILTPLRSHWYGDGDAEHSADNSKQKRVLIEDRETPGSPVTCSSQKTGVYYQSMLPHHCRHHWCYVIIDCL